jgi:hypothetical protein
LSSANIRADAHNERAGRDGEILSLKLGKNVADRGSPSGCGD